MPKGYPKNGKNKGWFKKGQSANKNTQFKKGESRSPHTQFEKGQTPWNKGTKGLQQAWNKGKPCPEEMKKRISEKLRKIDTPVIMQVRDCWKMKAWTQAVFKRDNYMCQWCNQKGKRLHAHHLKLFIHIFRENNITSLQEALFCEELWNISNGLTLCVSCHKKVHSIIGNGKAREVQN